MTGAGALPGFSQRKPFLVDQSVRRRRRTRLGRPQPVLRESGGTMHYNASNGLGAVTSDICCGHAIRLAKATVKVMCR